MNSRPHTLGRVRRRSCGNCGHRWTTLETAVIDELEATNIRGALHEAMLAMDKAWSAMEQAAAIWGRTPVQEGYGPITSAGTGPAAAELETVAEDG